MRWPVGRSCSHLYLRIILVDSTRAGKRTPDALSKTVPIWCAVMNRAIAKKFPSGVPSEWETSLFTPPASVSRQEHHQIEKRIDEWAEDLVVNPYFDLAGAVS
jgi:tRNA A64-2'-O-ribosylphosphate transferase